MNSPQLGHRRRRPLALDDRPRPRGVLDEVVDERVDPLRPRRAEHRDRLGRQVGGGEHPRSHGVVDVVVDVGDAVDRGGRSCPRASPAPRPAGVAEDAVAHRLGQVQAAPVALEHVDDAQRVLVVAEAVAAEALAQAAVERLLADVPERRVTEVVAEPDRLDQVLVERAAPGRRCARSGSPRACASAACGSGRPAGATNTWVLCLRRRNALQWTIRSRSRWNGVRSPQSGSSCSRARRVGAASPAARVSGLARLRRPRSLGDRPSGRRPGCSSTLSPVPFCQASGWRSCDRCATHDGRRGRAQPHCCAWCSAVSRDRPLGLAQGPRRGRRASRPAAAPSAATMNCVGVLVERERRRLARAADHAAGRGREADEVLALPAARAGGELRHDAGREQQLEAEGQRVAGRACAGSASSRASSLASSLKPRDGLAGLEQPRHRVAGPGGRSRGRRRARAGGRGGRRSRRRSP